jgi:hypothetical protein
MLIADGRKAFEVQGWAVEVLVQLQGLASSVKLISAPNLVNSGSDTDKNLP